MERMGGGGAFAEGFRHGHFRGSVDFCVETRFGHDIYIYIVTNIVDKC